MSIQLTEDAASVMGTGALDLPSQLWLTDREFSLTGFNQQNGNSQVFQIAQLAGAVGLDVVPNGILENTAVALNSGIAVGGLPEIELDDDDFLTITVGPKLLAKKPPIQFSVSANAINLMPSAIMLTV